MSNWPMNDNRAHSNWTGRTLRQDTRPGLFVDLKEEKPPHWFKQALIGCLAAAAFILVFWVTT